MDLTLEQIWFEKLGGILWTMLNVGFLSDSQVEEVRTQLDIQVWIPKQWLEFSA